MPPQQQHGAMGQVHHQKQNLQHQHEPLMLGLPNARQQKQLMQSANRSASAFGDEVGNETLSTSDGSIVYRVFIAEGGEELECRCTVRLPSDGFPPECTCSFNTSRLIPCRHICGVLFSSQRPLYDVSSLNVPGKMNSILLPNRVCIADICSPRALAYKATPSLQRCAAKYGCGSR